MRIIRTDAVRRELDRYAYNAECRSRQIATEMRADGGLPDVVAISGSLAPWTACRLGVQFAQMQLAVDDLGGEWRQVVRWRRSGHAVWRGTGRRRSEMRPSRLRWPDPRSPGVAGPP